MKVHYMRRATSFTMLCLAVVASGTLYLTSSTKAETMKPEHKETLKKLDEMQVYVTQHDGTEPPFKNKYWNNHADGIYVDVVSGEPLFSSTDKFDSGTGWPSFTQPIGANYVTQKTDSTLGMSRTEVRSKEANSHLGHVFDDGPKSKGGKRYCINSASLRFVPKEELITQGYTQYLGLFEKK